MQVNMEFVGTALCLFFLNLVVHFDDFNDFYKMN